MQNPSGYERGYPHTDGFDGELSVGRAKAIKAPRIQGERGRKKAEQIKLRLATEDCEHLRVAAAAAGKTVSTFVIALLEGGGSVAPPTRDEIYEQTFVEIAKFSNAIHALVENLRLSRADLSRAIGLLRTLFDGEGDAAVPTRAELHDAIRQAQVAIANNHFAATVVAAAIESLQATSSAAVREMAALLRKRSS
jgi:hypothetical protein